MKLGVTEQMLKHISLNKIIKTEHTKDKWKLSAIYLRMNFYASIMKILHLWKKHRRNLDPARGEITKIRFRNVEKQEKGRSSVIKSRQLSRLASVISY